MEKRKIYIYLAAAVLVIAGYFFYTIYQKKQSAEFELEVQVADFEDKIASQCENGEWIEFPDYSQGGKFSEYKDNVNLKSESDDEFTNQDGSIVFVTDENYSLEFFSDREVRIEGLNIGNQDNQKIYVKKIKCVGKEANADSRNQRQNLMKYVSENINSLAIENSRGGNWQVETFYFANDTDVYVEYESPGSITGDSPYDARLWLIRASKMDSSVPAIETLAYIQEDEIDPEKNVVKFGQDLYADMEDMLVYEFDNEKKSWVLQ